MSSFCSGNSRGTENLNCILNVLPIAGVQLCLILAPPVRWLLNNTFLRWYHGIRPSQTVVSAFILFFSHTLNWNSSWLVRYPFLFVYLSHVHMSIFIQNSPKTLLKPVQLHLHVGRDISSIFILCVSYNSKMNSVWKVNDHRQRTSTNVTWCLYVVSVVWFPILWGGSGV